MYLNDPKSDFFSHFFFQILFFSRTNHIIIYRKLVIFFPHMAIVSNFFFPNVKNIPILLKNKKKKFCLPPIYVHTFVYVCIKKKCSVIITLRYKRVIKIHKINLRSPEHVLIRSARRLYCLRKNDSKQINSSIINAVIELGRVFSIISTRDRKSFFPPPLFMHNLSSFFFFYFHFAKRNIRSLMNLRLKFNYGTAK